MEMTPEKADTSRAGAEEGSRKRKRLEVGLANRTGDPCGSSRYSLRNRWTAAMCSASPDPEFTC
ncbi:hypothetical protein GCM10007079_36920 [Nocardiopsis terrae]|nr:hypothetical protein GCM10007079_36920 [Nocardiopsis terrae]